MRRGKKYGILLACALALVCVLLLPGKAQAAAAAEGTCGEDLAWVLDDAGTLTISGTGRMTDFYDWSGPAPWCNYRSSVLKVVVGDGVTHIGYQAFTHCANLKTIELPDSLESIGAGAFYGCGFTRFEIPDDFLKIDSSTFAMCTALESVVIPDSVMQIAPNAFLGCSGLKEVTIGTGVTSIGIQAFMDCTALEKVQFNAVSANDFQSINDVFKNAGTAGDGIVLTVGKNVTRIPSRFMNPCYSSQNGPKVVAVVFEEGSVCTAIHGEAFSNCDELTRLELPDSLIIIGFSAFSHCFGLEEITIPDSVTTLEYYAFVGCESLQKVLLGKSLKSGMPEAFVECNSLTAFWVDGENPNYSADRYGVLFNDDLTVLIECPSGYEGAYTIPSTVKTIGNNAFSSRRLLTEVTIPGSVTKIGDGAFHGVELSDISIPDGVITVGRLAFSYCENLTSMHLPDSVRTVGYNAFEGCSSLKSVYLGKGVSNLDKEAFGMTGVQNAISVHKDNTAYCTVGGVLYTKDLKTVISCPRKKAGSCTIADGAKTIEPFCFYNCHDLTALIMPDTVERIENNAFTECRSMAELKLSASLVYIGGGALAQCSSLVEIYIPDGVEMIDGSTFSGCEKLEHVTFGTGVNRIFWNVFSYCDNLKTIVFTGDAPQIDGDAFFYVNATAYYPGSNSSWTGDKLNSYGGFITWIPVFEQVDNIRLTTPALLLGYGVGDTLDASKIGVEVLSDGQWYPIHYSLLQLSDCNMTIAGRKTVTVSYGGRSVELIVPVHEREQLQVDAVLYPESSHNYGNDINETKILTVSGASKLTLVFSEKTKFENGYDKLRVLNKNDELVAEFTGTEAAGRTLDLAGDTVKLQLISDGSTSYYGYSFTEITAVADKHVGTAAQDREATCTQSGHAGAVFCQICQDYAGGEVFPALGHDYEQIITAPLPGKQGYTTHICVRCGATKVDSYTDYQTISGQCGENVTWQLDNEGLLRIGGAGPMDNYAGSLTRTASAKAPWTEYAAYITGIVVDNGVTHIGSNVFGACDNATAVQIGEDVASIGGAAFAGCTALERIAFAGAAPTIAQDAFGGVRALVVYPAEDTSWTEQICQNYAGALAWGTQSGRVAVMGSGVYETFEQALAACDGTTYLKLLADVQVDISLRFDLYVDLNGFDLSGTVTTNGYKLYGMDSSTNSYNCAAIGYMNLVDENGSTVVPVSHFKSGITGQSKRYMAIKNENGYSFHRFYLGITHMSVKPTTTGVGYKGVFYGDEMVAANLGSFGFTLQLGEHAPITVTMDGQKFVSGKVFTLRIDNYDVDNYGEATLLACATMQLADGTVIQSTTASMTMRSLMERLNSCYTELAVGHLAVIRGMIERYAIIRSWKVENLI